MAFSSVRRTRIVLLGGLWLGTLWQSPASAGDLIGMLGADTDDVFRGVSLSDNQPSLQGALHYDADQWYVGLSAEEVRRGPARSAGVELIGFGGYQYRLSDDWTVAVSLRHYDYPGNPYRSEYDYDEGALRLQWRQWSLAAIASPDTFAADRSGYYARGAAFAYELAVQQPLPWALSAEAGAGYYDLQREIGIGYVYWNAGLSRPWHDWQFDVRYIGTDSVAVRRFGNEAVNRAVLSALWSF